MKTKTRRPKIKTFEIQWDSDYGIAHRRGWSIVINGGFAGDPFSSNPILALWRAWQDFKHWDEDK